jgi:hypothetical protein
MLWYWSDNKDYFQMNYNDIPEEQPAIFKWQEGDNAEKLKQRYRQHFFDTDLSFPRLKTAKVKLFRNIPFVGIFTVRTLKPNFVDSLVNFCNDSANFDWGETTWAVEESEYYFRLYNYDDKIIGQLYLCLEDCFMTDARPFCPAMKFGMLSLKGFENITTLVDNKSNWE